MPRASALVTAVLFIAGWPIPPPLAAEDPARLVRDSPARTPEEERSGFHLPEGFEIQLFADDAQLGGKPINMAFDARGRLWVTCTQEYPFAVKKEKWNADTTRAVGSKDTIRILEDTDGDGRADKVTVFADDLNIPTGVQPYKNGCIAWSIPNILFLEDTRAARNDKSQNTNHRELPAPLKADKRTILFGPLGYEKDTHGMISSMRLGLDGWIYATHGFSNTSHFQVLPQNCKPNQEPGTKNQETLDITSGSVFRFKPDGSAVELWTSGQVNPFGLCWDSWGNLYSADCHSSPIYQLIRGATYPQFGTPADALGFGPVMCEHAHGSTGIAGIIYLDGGVWGPEWDDHMFVGNPVTSKVNHDHITFTGSTPKANEEPDFITSDDDWFRPVDLQLGPDSALYIADFYNKIIGHYEVPLDDQRRDRSSGRIWRVARKGYTGKLTECDLAKLEFAGIRRELNSSNLTRRLLAQQCMIQSKNFVDLLFASGGTPEPPHFEHVAAIGSAFQIPGWITPESAGPFSYHKDFSSFSGPARSALLSVMRSFAFRGRPQSEAPFLLFDRDAFLEKSSDDEPRVKLAFLGFAASHPELISFNWLAKEWTDAARIDPELSYNWKIAVRNRIQLPGAYDALRKETITASLRDELIRISCAVPTAEAANWLLEQIKISDMGSSRREETQNSLPTGKDSANTVNSSLLTSAATDHALLITALTHIARHLPAERESELVELVQQHFGDDLDTQLDLFAAVREGRATRKDDIPVVRNWDHPDDRNVVVPSVRSWAATLAKRLVDSLSAQQDYDWQPVPSSNPQSASPWFRLDRPCADGKERPMLDSHPPNGEKLTGTLRSKTFDLPPQLSFWLAGHRGFPTAPAHEKNLVRLVDADTGHEIALAFPARHNTAIRITWQTGKMPAKRAYLELVDGDDATSYAWLAAGGFEPAVVDIPDLNSATFDKRVRAAAELALMPPERNEPAAKHVTSTALSSMIMTDSLAFPELHKLAASLPHRESFSPDTRVALARTSILGRLLPPAEFFELARDNELATTVFSILGDHADDHAETAKAFKSLTTRAQIKLASALASSNNTAATLLKVAPPRVLADPLVSGKLKALNDETLTQQLVAITANLPSQNEALNTLIAARLQSYDPAKADADRGKAVFAQVCVACHRIGVLGNLVGPQLDGIGARGPERLLEDILDPNRAVDPAFRLHIVRMTNGELIAGLLRREQDGALIFADAAAQEHVINKTTISADQISEFSLMPSGLGEALTEEQVHDLLKFLLDRK